MSRQPLIIDRPDALNKIRRRTEWSMTTIGWVIWFTLCRPILMLALWVFGIRQMYVHMVKLHGFPAVLEFFKVYGWVILGIAVALRLWNYYNIVLFRNRERRRHVRETTSQEMERSFGLPDGSLTRIQSWREVAVVFDSDGRVQFHRSGAARALAHEVVNGRLDPMRSSGIGGAPSSHA